MNAKKMKYNERLNERNIHSLTVRILAREESAIRKCFCSIREAPKTTTTLLLPPQFHPTTITLSLTLTLHADHHHRHNITHTEIFTLSSSFKQLFILHSDDFFFVLFLLCLVEEKKRFFFGYRKL
jgi:hypothetical protein